MGRFILRDERTGKIKYTEDVERVCTGDYPIYYSWSVELDFTVNKKNMDYFYKTIKRYMVSDYSIFSHTVVDDVKIIDYVLGNKYRKINPILKYQRIAKCDLDCPILRNSIILILVEEPVLMEYLEDIKIMIEDILYKLKDVGIIIRLQGG